VDFLYTFLKLSYDKTVSHFSFGGPFNLVLCLYPGIRHSLWTCLLKHLPLKNPLFEGICELVIMKITATSSKRRLQVTGQSRLMTAKMQTRIKW